MNAKKLMVGGAVLAGLLAVFVLVNVFVLNGDDEEEEGPVRETVEMREQLPDIINVDAEKNPALYDFLNGSIGWHWQRDLNDLMGVFYAFAWKQENPQVVWGSYYSIAESLILPPLGNEPSGYNLSSQDVQMLDITLQHMKEEVPQNVQECNGWNVVLVEMYHPDGYNPYGSIDQQNKWAGIPVTNFSNMERYGLLQQTINVGAGWPIDYLKVEWLQENLKVRGWDLTNEFWNAYSPMESFQLNGPDGSNPIFVTVKNIDQFEVDDNGHKSTMNGAQIEHLCKVRGYARNEK